MTKTSADVRPVRSKSDLGAKICITGGEGFIGSHAVTILGKEHEIISYDLKSGKDIRRITPEELAGVDYLFHFAAKPRVQYSIDFPEEAHDHNLNGFLRVLVAARDAGVKRVVLSSSASVYGTQDTMPLVETMHPNPLSPYALQKLGCEIYARQFSEFFGMETVVLRYFNVYGENFDVDSPYAMCVPIFLKLKNEGKPLTVYGGKQTRDFTYVKDVVRANILAATSPKVGKGEIINIGGGINYSIDTIAETLTRKDKIIHEEQRKGEPMHALADIRKAKELLGWEPSQDLLTWLKTQ